MKVCKDSSVPGDNQKKRAEAITELGGIWAELKAKNPDKQEKDARRVSGLFPCAGVDYMDLRDTARIRIMLQPLDQ